MERGSRNRGKSNDKYIQMHANKEKNPLWILSVCGITIIQIIV